MHPTRRDFQGMVSSEPKAARAALTRSIGDASPAGKSSRTVTLRDRTSHPTEASMVFSKGSFSPLKLILAATFQT